MTVTTKYDTGETVYFIHNGNIAQGIIRAITIRKAYHEPSIGYEVNMSNMGNSGYLSLAEKVLFTVKREAATAWLAEQNMEVAIAPVAN